MCGFVQAHVLIHRSPKGVKIHKHWQEGFGFQNPHYPSFRKVVLPVKISPMIFWETQGENGDGFDSERLLPGWRKWAFSGPGNPFLVAHYLVICDSISCDTVPPYSFQGPLNGGGFKRGGFPDLDLSFRFCPFWDFPDFSGIFPICLGTLRGFSQFALFLFLGLLTAPTRNSPERVRDTIGTFPEKVGNPLVWKPPCLASPKAWYPENNRIKCDTPLPCRAPLLRDMGLLERRWFVNTFTSKVSQGVLLHLSRDGWFQAPLGPLRASLPVLVESGAGGFARGALPPRLETLIISAPL